MAKPAKTPRVKKLTPEVEAELLELLASGKTLLQVCESDEKFPVESVIRRKALEDQEFGAKYVRAREIGYLRMADELIEIIDDGRNDWMTVKKGQDEIEVVNREAVERSKLRFQGRQWLLSKALPKIFGDKLDVNAKHEAGDSFKALWAALGKEGAGK
jgi:hypothetical protein